MKAEFETLQLTKMQRKLLLYLADNFGACVSTTAGSTAANLVVELDLS